MLFIPDYDIPGNGGTIIVHRGCKEVYDDDFSFLLSFSYVFFVHLPAPGGWERK